MILLGAPCFGSPSRRRRWLRAAPTCAWSPTPINRLDVAVAAARRAHVRQLLPQLPQREVHALQPADRPRHRPADDRGQPDVRDRQGRRDDDGRDDASRRQGVVRRAAAGPDGRIARARRGLAVQLFPRFLPRRRRRSTGWNNLVFPNVAMPHVLWQLSGDQPARHRRVRRATTRRRPRRSPPRALSLLAPGKDDTFVVETLVPETPGHAVADRISGRWSPISSITSITWPSPRKNKRISLGLVVLLYPRRAVRSSLTGSSANTGRTSTERRLVKQLRGRSAMALDISRLPFPIRR